MSINTKGLDRRKLLVDDILLCAVAQKQSTKKTWKLFASGYTTTAC